MCCKAAGRVMRDQRSGRIVNITSPGSRMALPDYTAYTASKAGVDSITRALAVALAPYGVLVNSLAPGMMDTEMQRSTEADLARRHGRADLQAFLDERTAPRAARPPRRDRRDRRLRRLARPRRAALHDRRPAERLGRPRQGLSLAAQRPARDRRPARAAPPRRPAAPAHARDGARPGPGLHRPGPRHRRRPRRALLPRAALRPGEPRLGRSATASCSRPAIIRSRSGRRSPRPGSCRWRSSRPTAPTTAGWRCRPSTPPPASR